MVPLSAPVRSSGTGSVPQENPAALAHGVNASPAAAAEAGHGRERNHGREPRQSGEEWAPAHRRRQ